MKSKLSDRVRGLEALCFQSHLENKNDQHGLENRIRALEGVLSNLVTKHYFTADQTQLMLESLEGRLKHYFIPKKLRRNKRRKK